MLSIPTILSLLQLIGIRIHFFKNKHKKRVSVGFYLNQI